MAQARLPKMPNPEKISFGNLKFVDYLAQVEPLDEEGRNNYDGELDTPLEFEKMLWEAVMGKSGRIRYEAACSLLSEKMMVPKHEVCIQIERHIMQPGSKFVRLRIRPPHHTDPSHIPNFINWEAFGYRRQELEDNPNYKMMGVSVSRRRHLQEAHARQQTEAVRNEFRKKREEEESNAPEQP